MPVHGSGLGARVHAARVGYRACTNRSDGGARLAALELGEALLEVVQQACGVGADRLRSFGRRDRRRTAAKRAQSKRALPPLSSENPGSHSQELKLLSIPEQQAHCQSAQAHDRRDQPKFAHAIDIIRSQKPRQYR